MTTTSDLSYEDRLKQEAERMLTRIKIEESSSNEEENIRLIAFSRVFGNTYKRCFFKKNKLCLVLDLDHTLLHSVSVHDVSKDDQDYLNKKAIVVSSTKSMKDVLHSSGDNLYNYMGRYTKLRPHTREFLKQLSDRFELFVYTMGSWEHARDMAKLLDRDGVFFKSIVSRDDSTIRNRKNLDILAGPDEKNTIIIDDHKHVWEEHINNVIRIHKYKYFTEENGGHVLKKNEEEGFGDEDESLKSISKVLRRVHKKFFKLFPVPQTDVELQEYITSVDVRPTLNAYMKKISGRKGEESKQVQPETIAGADLSQVPPDNRLEDLIEEENIVEDADETCDQEPSKVSEFEAYSKDKISSDEDMVIGKVKSLETNTSRFPLTNVQNMDELLKATALLEVSNGGTEVDMKRVFSGIPA